MNKLLKITFFGVSVGLLYQCVGASTFRPFARNVYGAITLRRAGLGACCAGAAGFTTHAFRKCNNPEERLDVAFGKKGVVTTGFKDTHAGTINSEVPAFNLLVQPDGKIILAGDLYNTVQNATGHAIFTHERTAIMRYHKDGLLDTTFGRQGYVILPNSACTSIAIQERDKLLIAAKGFHKGRDLCDAVLLRLNGDGSLDTSFGKEGSIVENNGAVEFSNVFKILVQENGGIVGLGNYIYAEPSDPYKARTCQFYITRYHNNGVPQSDFGDQGKLKVFAPVGIASKVRVADRFLDGYWGGLIQKDGKIVGVGSVGDFGSYIQQQGAKEADQTLASDGEDSIIARYLPDGSPDSSFGPHGNGFILTSAGKGCNYFVDVAEDADNHLIALGRAKNSITRKAEFMLVRYLRNGALDTTFGKDGMVLSAVGSHRALAHKLCVQPDGKRRCCMNEYGRT